MQTAVEFLLKWINDNLSESLIPIHIKEQANKMFEQQSKNDYYAGLEGFIVYGGGFEQYYNETYGSKGSDETKTDKI